MAALAGISLAGCAGTSSSGNATGNGGGVVVPAAPTGLQTSAELLWALNQKVPGNIFGAGAPLPNGRDQRPSPLGHRTSLSDDRGFGPRTRPRSTCFHRNYARERLVVHHNPAGAERHDHRRELALVNRTRRKALLSQEPAYGQILSSHLLSQGCLCLVRLDTPSDGATHIARNQ